MRAETLGCRGSVWLVGNLAYTDDRLKNDPALSEWVNDPLGHTTRVVLFLVLQAWKSFVEQLRTRKVLLTMGSHYMPPLLLLCIAHHAILAFGTVRKARIGISGAYEFWRKHTLAVTDWKNSRDAALASTAHVFETYTFSLGYKKRAKGGVDLEPQQPTVRAA